MKKMIFLVFSILVIIMVFNGEMSAMNTMPNVTNEMQNADFWINKLDDANKVIMTQEEINKLNKMNINVKGEHLYDLMALPDNLSKYELLQYLNIYSFPKEYRYMNGEKVDGSFYYQLNIDMNFNGVNENNNIPYGMVVKRTRLRTFPTDKESFLEPTDREFDMFQEATLEVAEPVRILHISLDNQWYYVQAVDYIGWVKIRDIAIAKYRMQWEEYLNVKDFIVVTANKMFLGENQYSPQISKLQLGMGVKLPIMLSNTKPTVIDNQYSAANYIVLLPTRNKNGELVIKQGLVPINSDVSIGYLPYTSANILKQAFKMQGDRYGWGGMFNSRDCSGMPVDVFRCFRIFLSRNPDGQEMSIGKSIYFDANDSIQKRYKKLDLVSPGSLVFMFEHVMIYLGKHNDNHYVMHSFGSMADPSIKNADGAFETITILSIVVSDLNIIRTTGVSFAELLTSAKQIVGLS